MKKYVPTEPDELALEESDVVNVFKKLEDGKSLMIQFFENHAYILPNKKLGSPNFRISIIFLFFQSDILGRNYPKVLKYWDT